MTIKRDGKGQLRDYDKEYKNNQKKRVAYRSELNSERDRLGIQGNGNSDTHVAHAEHAKGKTGGKVGLQEKSKNLSDQPKTKKRRNT
jgi:hypothetical protein